MSEENSVTVDAQAFATLVRKVAELELAVNELKDLTRLERLKGQATYKSKLEERN